MNKARISHRYGCVPDRADSRDHLYGAPSRLLRALPPEVLLDGPPMYNQGQAGSCTGQMVARLHHMRQLQDQRAFVAQPSARFAYYNTRAIRGRTGSDSGGSIRDAIKAAAATGICEESIWPYSDKREAIVARPSDAAFVDASLRQVVAYQRITPTLDQLRGCLADGNAFGFGFAVFPSFESEETMRTGMAPMPTFWERIARVLGWHAIVCSGYSDTCGRFRLDNSWGTTIGQSGRFWLPYDFLVDSLIARDLWTIFTVEQ